MKNITLIISILILIISSSFGQRNSKSLNGYKYAYIQKLQYQNGQIDIFGLSFKATNFFKERGFTILGDNDVAWSKEAHLNPCQILSVIVSNNGGSQVLLEIRNCKNETIYTDKHTSANWVGDFQDNYNRSLKNIFKRFGNYKLSYDPSKTPILTFPEVEKTNETESSLKAYLNSNKIDKIEGIYKSYQSG